MRISIITVGSRGDIQPYVALGVGLKAAGHEVKIVTIETFEPLIREVGLEMGRLKGDVRELMNSENGLKFMESGKNPVRLLKKMMEMAEPYFRQMGIDATAACKDSDLIIASTLVVSLAEAICEKYGNRCLPTFLQPIMPTTCIHSVFTPKPPSWFGPLIGGYNWLTHFLVYQASWQVTRGIANRQRKELFGLPPAPLFGYTSGYNNARSNGGLAMLYGFSNYLVPGCHDRWKADTCVSGFWFLDSATNFQPPDDLTDFLDSGPAPVYVGFGSMMDRSPQEITEIVLDAVKKSGQRAVLLNGWAGIGQRDMPDNIFLIDSAPHDWLFPRMSALVHHGGAGTTAAGLRAGKPTVTIPFIADQPFWGERVADLGLGTPPIPRKKLTAERLANAIQAAVTDKAMRSRAEVLGKQIAAEHGVERAVEAIERSFGK